MERADPWDRYNLYNLNVTYAFGSAHVKFDVWIEVELLPFYSTGAVELNGGSTQIQNCPILTDSYVDLYMRRTKWLGSAHVKFGV